MTHAMRRGEVEAIQSNASEESESELATLYEPGPRSRKVGNDPLADHLAAQQH